MKTESTLYFDGQFWIGYFPIQNVVSYPVRGFLSTLLLRSYATARGPDDVRVGPMMCAWATPPTRRSWGLRAYRGVNGQPLVASVARFRFQAGEAAFLFSFLTFLLLGRGSSFSCHAFAFCLNRCL